MGRQFQFWKAVVPIFEFDGDVGNFLGTGTFVGDPAYLATADHVVRSWDGDFAIMFPPSPIHWNVNAFRARLVSRDPDFDLAILDASPFQPEFSVMPAGDGEVANNIPVLSYEYGTTRSVAGIARLAPATRMGNVTRVIDLSEHFGKAGSAALELSFPALRGASGAPVIGTNDYSLWGIIVANFEYHLLPVQIEAIVSDSGSAEEEVKYLLPQAIAVNVKHLRRILDRAASSS